MLHYTQLNHMEYKQQLSCHYQHTTPLNHAVEFFQSTNMFDCRRMHSSTSRSTSNSIVISMKTPHHSTARLTEVLSDSKCRLRISLPLGVVKTTSQTGKCAFLNRADDSLISAIFRWLLNYQRKNFITNVDRARSEGTRLGHSTCAAQACSSRLEGDTCLSLTLWLLLHAI